MTVTILSNWKKNAVILKRKHFKIITSEKKYQEKVAIQKNCEVKRKKKSTSLRITFRTDDYLVLKTKSQLAGCTINNYIRIASLESNYRPLLNPDIHKDLLALNNEITKQGRSLNNILLQMNTNFPDSQQIIGMINEVRIPLIFTLKAIKNALVQGEPQP